LSSFDRALAHVMRHNFQHASCADDLEQVLGHEKFRHRHRAREHPKELIRCGLIVLQCHKQELLFEWWRCERGQLQGEFIQGEFRGIALLFLAR